MSEADVIAEFYRRVLHDWLPSFCNDPAREFGTLGFQAASIRVSAADARNCMRAIDSGIVVDLGGGRYRAKHSTANEQLFWTGSRGIVPRRVTLWLEPVITFAAMARLRYEFNWPAELIALQPRSWAFDLAAHSAEDAACYRVLGKVKKTVREARALEDALRWLSEGQEETKLSKNAVRKWKALLHDRPPVVWIVGPEGHSVIYSVEYHPSGGATLILDTEERLLF